ncbi:hypothetical protein MCC10128_1051 [Bifidobacterium longum subsp. longum]|uniref:hypothetical protein n=1 Tax=Bifidobacterium longum TaxID=216816 RepID=UPI0010DCCE5F|nr:hypothetical protein [Bifidobacterium longum]TCF83949.1 hypothetical protein MCC10128_1051 [Bifidobacterium longum subsp. longum]
MTAALGSGSNATTTTANNGSDWYAYEDDLLFDAKDDGWQILYKDEHPELERDMHYCPAHRLPECSTCTNIMIDPAGWKDGQCPECRRLGIPGRMPAGSKANEERNG